MNSRKLRRLIESCLYMQLILNKAENEGIMYESCTDPDRLGSAINKLDDNICREIFCEAELNWDDDSVGEDFVDIIKQVQSVEEIPATIDKSFHYLVNAIENRGSLSDIEFHTYNRVYKYESIIDMWDTYLNRPDSIPDVNKRIFHLYIGGEYIKKYDHVYDFLMEVSDKGQWHFMTNPDKYFGNIVITEKSGVTYINHTYKNVTELMAAINKGTSSSGLDYGDEIIRVTTDIGAIPPKDRDGIAEYFTDFIKRVTMVCG